MFHICMLLLLLLCLLLLCLLLTYIYIYIRIYIYIYIYIYTYIYTYISMLIHVYHALLRYDKCIWIHQYCWHQYEHDVNTSFVTCNMYDCVRVYINYDMCIHICACVCIYIYIYTYTYKYRYTYISLSLYIYIYIYIEREMYMILLLIAHPLPPTLRKRGPATPTQYPPHMKGAHGLSLDSEEPALLVRMDMPRAVRASARRCASRRARARTRAREHAVVQAPDGITPFIGWSNNHVNNLHLRSSLGTNELSTCAAEQPLTCCVVAKRRLSKW